MNMKYYKYTSKNPYFNKLMAMVIAGEPLDEIQVFINSMNPDNYLYCVEMLLKTPPIGEIKDKNGNN
jgi:hypothetical protein